jgi:hypothetical protein
MSNYCRFYQVEESVPELGTETHQHEVARSTPNDLMPTVEWQVPPEVEVTKVRVVVGYGNTDVYIHTLPLLFKPEDVEVIQGELPSIEPVDKARRKVGQSEPQ